MTPKRAKTNTYQASPVNRRPEPSTDRKSESDFFTSSRPAKAYANCMKAFLVDISAFQLWFGDQGVVRTGASLARVDDFAFATSDRADSPLNQIKQLGLCGQLHVAVPSHSMRHHQSGITAHVLHSPAPYSFVRLSKDVYVESPGATAIRMAARLKQGELAVMLNQLLSGCRISNGVIVRARPLTTKTQLVNRLTASKGERGVKIVRSALAYAVPDTASPAEAQVAALLTLPAKWGGKGLPLPEANAAIPLHDPLAISEQGKEGCRKTTLRYADFLWRTWNLILEYDSDAFHASKDRLGLDSARRAELQREGFSVITLTNHQLSSVEDFSVVTDALLAKMNRADRTARIEHYGNIEKALRKQVFSFDPNRIGMG